MLREQYEDRWSFLAEESGILEIAERPSAETLKRFPIFEEFPDKFLEELSPDVAIATWEENSVLFEEGTYLDRAFYIHEGQVELYIQQQQGTVTQPIFDTNRTGVFAGQEPDQPVTTATRRIAESTTGSDVTFLATMTFDLPRGAKEYLGSGEIFGEIGAMSGWPQSVTARTITRCELVQIRVGALRRLRRKSKGFKAYIDDFYRERSLFNQLRTTPLLRDCDPRLIGMLQEKVELVSCDPGEVIVKEGEPAEDFYLVRSGFVKIGQRLADGEIAVAYLSKGMTLGETELLIEGQDHWTCTASSVEYSDLVKISSVDVRRALEEFPEIKQRLWQTVVSRIKETGANRSNISNSEFLKVALEQGLVEGSSILVIDLDVCTRCDDCVRACADTHQGQARFVREGDKYQNLLITKACYHCRDPVCLVGCPTGAIHRTTLGGVVEIRDDLCIGCRACAANCPYDAIVMRDTGEAFPDDMMPRRLRGKPRMLATKCDQCNPLGHGPACVSNCPHGCASRVGSVEEFQKLLQRGQLSKSE